MVGNVQIGGQNKVVIQSMCNTKTKDVEATVKQILELEKAGCEIIRVACLDIEDAKAIKEIKKMIHIPIVCDQKGTPTCAVDLASAILKIMSTSEKAKSLFGKKSALPYGVYHFTNLGETTWFDFTKKIYEFGKKYGRITKDCAINSCTTDEYPCAAKRPAYSVLSKDKIQTLLKIKIPEWQETLEKFIKSDRFLIK